MERSTSRCTRASGGWAGSVVSLGLDPRDLSAGNGWGNAMRDLSSHTPAGGALHIFKLSR